MKPELQDGRYSPPRVSFNLRKTIDVPGIENQRLLADRIGAGPQCEAAMRVMEMIRRTDGHIVDLLAAAAKLIDVPVEPLKLGKEMRVRKVNVENSNRIIWVVRDP